MTEPLPLPHGWEGLSRKEHMMPGTVQSQQNTKIFTIQNTVIFMVDALLLLITISSGDWVWGMIFVGAAFWSYRICFKETPPKTTGGGQQS